MQQEPEKILESIFELENSAELETNVENLINQAFQGNKEYKEMRNDSFDVEVKTKAKELMLSVVKKSKNRIGELEDMIDLQNEEMKQFKTDVKDIFEENEQLNEVSSILSTEVQKLKKYLNEYGIYISILRGDIYKHKHQNKMLLNALQLLHEGDEEAATKILKNVIENNQITDGLPDRTPDSAEVRPASFINEEMLHGVKLNLKFKHSESISPKKNPKTTMNIRARYYQTAEPVNYLTSLESLSPGKELLRASISEEDGVVNVDDARDGELYSLDATVSEVLLERNLSQYQMGAESVSPVLMHKRHNSVRPLLIFNQEEMNHNEFIMEEEEDGMEPFMNGEQTSTEVTVKENNTAQEETQKRLSKWLFPNHNFARTSHNRKRKRRMNIEGLQNIDIEDQISLFIEISMEEAKRNTQIPIEFLIKMPITIIVGLARRIFRRNKK